MNKLLVTFVFLSLNLGFLEAQRQQYGKFKSEYRDIRGIVFYKDEIYKVTPSKNNQTIVYADTIISVASKEIVTIDSFEDKTDQKNVFVKKTTGDSLYINLESMNASDTIWLRGNNKNIPFLNKKVLTIAGVGDKFRLIIPNTVTIWYNDKELETYTPPESEPGEQNDTSKEDENKGGYDSLREKLPYIMLAIIALLIGIIVFLALPVLRREKDLQNIRYDGTDLERWASNHKTSIALLMKYNRSVRKILAKKEIDWDEIQGKLENKILKVKQDMSVMKDNFPDRNEVRYHGGSLKNFADDNRITLTELIRLNPEIPANYSTYCVIARWIIRNKLSRKELIVKQKPPDIQKNQDNKLINNKIDGFNKYLKDCLDFVEKKIDEMITEMRQLKPTEEFNYFISNLQAEVANKTSTITNLERQLHEKNSALNRVEQEKFNELNKAEQEKYNELNRVQQEKTQLMERLVNIQKAMLPAVFLRNYAAQVYDYLYYGQKTVYKSAVKLYNDLKQPDIAGLLLLNFETAVIDLQMDKWLQILFELKERGVIVTSNRYIIESFAQPQSENEKLREFKRFLFNELLLKYCSSLLILAESFRNLYHFGIDIDNVNETGFADFVRSLRNKAGGIGMGVKYVPLFEKVTDNDYLSLVKSVGSNMSRAYSGVSIQRDYIAEIVSYGIVTEFDDSEKTQIKLA